MPKRKKFIPTILNQKTHPNAAGIDIAAEINVAAVPADRDPNPVQTFSTFTSDLIRLKDWLLECGIDTVAIESTGNYWVCLYQILQDAGIEVFLVNARHISNVPGRKTDVCDAQWIQQLHQAGLLKKSFRPEKDIIPFRYLMRQRNHLIQAASEQLQMMQKILNEMNLHIHHVFSDIDGASATAIIQAIIQGQRDPETLAQLRDKRAKKPIEVVIEALKGDFRDEYIFILKQAFEHYQYIQKQIKEMDEQLHICLESIQGQCEDKPLPKAKWNIHRIHKNSPQISIYEQAWRFYGVDLSLIPSVSAGMLATLMSEIGNTKQLLKAFPTANKFCSWLGLCPDNRISGGKVLKAKTRKVNNRVSNALRMCAQALSNADCALGDFSRRMKARLGKAEGITATAHKLARIIYALLKHQTPYSEETVKKCPAKKAQNRLKYLQKQAEKVGMQLVPA